MNKRILDSNLREIIERTNSNSGNATLSDSEFLIHQDMEDAFDDYVNGFFNFFGVINLTERSIAYCREDGISIVVPPNNKSLISSRILNKFNGQIVFINTNVVALDAFDNLIGRADYHTRNKFSNASAVHDMLEFRTHCKAHNEHSFPYQSHMQHLIQERLFRIQGSGDYSSEIFNQTLNVTTVYSVRDEALSDTSDTYVPFLNLLIRKLEVIEEEVDNTGGRGRKYIRRRAGFKKVPMLHPMKGMTIVGLLKNLEGVIGDHTFVETISVVYDRHRTERSKAYLVRHGGIIELNVELTEDPEKEGFTIYRKNDYGVIEPTFHELSEMEVFGLYEFREKAEDVINFKYNDSEHAREMKALREAEQEAIRKRIKEENLRAEEIERRREEEKRLHEQKMEEIRSKREDDKRAHEFNREKIEATRKSDAKKTNSANIGLISAAIVALATLVKTLIPFNIFGFSLFGSAA